MDRNTNSSRLICDRSGDCLTDPPCRIRTEFISFCPVKFIYCLDQTQVSFLYQIQEQHPAAHIFLGYADNKTQVGFTKLLLRIFISCFHPFCQIDFLLCGQKRDFTDFLQVHTYRVIYRNILGNSGFQIDFLSFRIFCDNGIHFRIVHIFIVDFHQIQIIRLIFHNDLNALSDQSVIDFIHLIFIKIDIAQSIGNIRIAQRLLALASGLFRQIFDDALFHCIVQNMTFCIVILFCFCLFCCFFLFHIEFVSPLLISSLFLYFHKLLCQCYNFFFIFFFIGHGKPHKDLIFLFFQDLCPYGVDTVFKNRVRFII